MLARAGTVPERKLFWMDRISRLESWGRSRGRVPERDFEFRLIEVTRPEESHLTPCHLQGCLPDHPDGVGFKPFARLYIIDASSAVALMGREVRKMTKTTTTTTSGGGPLLVVVIIAVVLMVVVADGCRSSSSSICLPL